MIDYHSWIIHPDTLQVVPACELGHPHIECACKEEFDAELTITPEEEDAWNNRLTIY